MQLNPGEILSILAATQFFYEGVYNTSPIDISD